MPTVPRRVSGATRCTIAALLAGSVAMATASPSFAQQTDPDVVLDVPNLSVQSLTIDVDKLAAHIALDARVAQLVTLSAGVDLTTDKIHVDIQGVQAELHLRVRLDNVYKILDRTLTTVDKNPQILTGLLNAVNGLLSQTVNTLGQTVLRTVSATGDILESTVDGSGQTIGQTVVGNAGTLPVLSQTTNGLGQSVVQVKDTTGAVIELVKDASGKILSTKVISQSTSTTGR